MGDVGLASSISIIYELLKSTVLETSTPYDHHR